MRDILRSLNREVYCVLGIPVDGTDMQHVVDQLRSAAECGKPFILSTPNLNFLTNSRDDDEFRDSLLMSNLCPPDGISIICIARLLGIALNKVSGSDIFEVLKSEEFSQRPLKVFLFGSTATVAAEAARKINATATGLKCVGWISPGFGDLDELSRDEYIDEINASGADFLVAALGAKKGQLWLKRNHDRLTVPIRSHLGAVINFEAGTVKRAPLFWQRVGLEWLWRIKEEPALWKRYFYDGFALLQLLVTHLLPLALSSRSYRSSAGSEQQFAILKSEDKQGTTLHLVGRATAADTASAVPLFCEALGSRKALVIDCFQFRGADPRFFGLLLMLDQQARSLGIVPRFSDVNRRLRRQIHLNGLGYLL